MIDDNIPTQFRLSFACDALSVDVNERSGQLYEHANKDYRQASEDTLSVAVLFDVLKHRLPQENTAGETYFAQLVESCIRSSETEQSGIDELLRHADSPVGQLREKLNTTLFSTLQSRGTTSQKNVCDLLSEISKAADLLVDDAELHLLREKQAAFRRV